MKTILFPILFILSAWNVHAQSGNTRILMHTALGDIRLLLYDETPMHRDNFVELVQAGFYDGLLFHRVIKEFMIQTGDPESRDAAPGERLGNGGPAYTIPAEFNPKLYHKRGALAAARKGDPVNPARASSGSQFYIVLGKTFTDAQLKAMEQSRPVPFTEKQKQVYSSSGGTPHLDYAYTVFGEVLDGMDLVDKIAELPTDQYDRPLEDLVISMEIIENE